MKTSALILVLISVTSVAQVPNSTLPTNRANAVESQAAKPVVDVRNYGVVADGQVATNCSITKGTSIVTCSTAHFVASDVGKSVGMWGAGPTVFKAPKNYITALTTTIASYQSPTRVTLAANASNTADPSRHLVWGTENYKNIEAAIAAANTLYPNGYELFFPAGYYLTPTIDFPCGAVGRFGSFTCNTATKNVTIAGASQDSTTIENFVADRGSKGGTPGVCGNYTYNCGLIQFGSASTNDSSLQDAAHWVNGVTVHDLTLIEVENSNGTFFTEPQNIDLGNTSDAEVYNTYVEWSAYMCIAGGNEPSYIHDNYAYHCGWGGPAYAGTNSAINVVVPNSRTTKNRIYYSGQGIEGGAPNQEISYNFMEADDGKGNYPPASVTPEFCLNIGSATYGMWNTHVVGNTCVNWALGPGHGNSGNVGNGSGIMSNMVIENNTFINSGAFSLSSGLEGPATGWPSRETTADIHGTSIFSRISFRYDKDVTVGTQALGVILSSPAEKWIIDGVDIMLPGNASNCSSCVGLVLQNSFPAWQPSTSYTQSEKTPSLIQPPMPNGFYYVPIGASGKCVSGAAVPIFPAIVGNTVADNTCTWKNMGAKPVHVISNLHIGFPPGSTNGAFAIQNQGLLFSDFTFSNITGSGNTLGGVAGIGYTANGWRLAGFPVESWFQGEDVPKSTIHQALLREMSPYSSSQRPALSNNVFPAGDFYRVGDTLSLPTPSGEKSTKVCTVGGWKPKTWVPSNSYPYNAMVGASPDNQHAFIDTGAAGCTSGTEQPSWKTGAGAITKDTAGGGTCHWRESGPSAQFVVHSPN